MGYATANGVPLTEGLKVWNNELRRVTVTLKGSWEENGELWFYTAEGKLTSESRVSTIHPSTGERA